MGLIAVNLQVIWSLSLSLSQPAVAVAVALWIIARTTQVTLRH